MTNTSIELPDEMIESVEEIAHERSSPGDRVSRSEVIRDAITEFLEKSDDSEDPDDPVDEHLANA